MTDRSSPVFTVTVLDQDGNEEIIRPDEVHVLNLRYTDSEKKADKLALTVDNFDLSNFDSPVWKQGNRLRVSWGYLGRMAPARECVIRSVKGFQKLNVEANGLAVVMNRIQRSTTFENLTRSEIVRFVARDNGYGDDAVDIQETDVRFEHVVQANMTDAQFLRRLAHQEGVEFYVDFDGLHWHERRLDQNPVKTITWYVDQGQSEVISINIKNDVTALPGRVRVRGRDPINRRDISERADNAEDISRALLDRKLAVVSPDEGAQSGQLLVASESTTSTKPANAEGAKGTATGRFRRAQQQAVKMTLTMIGDPNILAKSVIEVQGIGQRLGGNFYVTEAVHELGPSGYILRLELIKDSTGSYSRRIARRRGDGLPEVAQASARGTSAKPQAAKTTASQSQDPSSENRREGVRRVNPQTGIPYLVFEGRRGRVSRTRGGRPAPPASTPAAQHGREDT